MDPGLSNKDPTNQVVRKLDGSIVRNEVANGEPVVDPMGLDEATTKWPFKVRLARKRIGPLTAVPDDVLS